MFLFIFTSKISTIVFINPESEPSNDIQPNCRILDESIAYL